MKWLTLLLLVGLCANAIGYLIKVPTTPAKPRIAPTQWVHIQKLMLPLFENVCEESHDLLVMKLSNEFTLDVKDYLRADVVEKLQGLKTGKGLLAKGEIYTEKNEDHFFEFRVIYEVLYNAKDFDTFYKAACWARQNVNCGVFIDAIYLAVITRKDTEKLSVPAPYELLPNYFIAKDFIVKASSLIAGEDISYTEGIREDGNNFIVDTNYTDCCEGSEESKLAYFREDIGLNSYFFLTQLKTMPWVNSDYQRDLRYGEHIYHIMKQLMTRYNLERYSNELYETEGINWDNIDETQFDPMLIYSNGNEFSSRTESSMNNSELISSLKTLENNIATTVTHMRDGGFSKAAILNHLMEIMILNDNSYVKLAMQAVNGGASSKSSPTVLGHYMTQLRDPIYWKINKKMVDIIDDALKVLPEYSKNQLYFPGVQVTNIDVKKMSTSFDTYEFDVTDALKYGDKEPNFQIKISQSRLDHKPFAIKVNVSSLVIQKGIVKLYLGPKVIPGEINENRKLFMLIDSFEVNLKRGINIITRSSNEINNLSDDFVPLRTVRKNVIDSEFGVDALSLNPVKSQIGFPSRLILPKGNSDGLPFQLFAFVAPYVKATPGGYKMNLQLNYDAILSPGYPLDLDIEIQELFNLPNALVKDFVIIHKTESKTSSYGGGGGYNPEKKWYGMDDVNYDMPVEPLALVARPEFTKRKDQFDYKSRKGQYGKKDPYSPEKVDKVVTIPEESVKDMEFNKVYTKAEDNNDNVEYTVISKRDDYRIVDKIITKEDKEESVNTSTDMDKTSNEIEIENTVKIQPAKLLSTHKRPYPSILNVILKPTHKELESNEKVYE